MCICTCIFVYTIRLDRFMRHYFRIESAPAFHLYSLTLLLYTYSIYTVQAICFIVSRKKK